MRLRILGEASQREVAHRGSELDGEIRGLRNNICNVENAARDWERARARTVSPKRKSVLLIVTPGVPVATFARHHACLVVSPSMAISGPWSTPTTLAVATNFEIAFGWSPSDALRRDSALIDGMHS